MRVALFTILASLIVVVASAATADTCHKFLTETVPELHGLANRVTTAVRAIPDAQTPEEVDFFGRAAAVEAGARAIKIELAARVTVEALTIGNSVVEICRM